MKIPVILRGIVVLSLTLFCACSSNDDAPATPASSVLIDKITETVYFGTESESSVANFSYEGEQLVRVDYAGSYQQYIYDGGKIAMIKLYSNDFLASTSTLNYSGNVLLSIESDGDNAERAQFISSGNGLTAIEYQYSNGDQWITHMREDFTFTATGNIAQRNRTMQSGAFATRNEYSYDTANNPLRDMNPYFRLITTFEGFDPKNQNNPLTQTSFSPPDAAEGTGYIYEYVYNALNFPTEIRRKTAAGTLISMTQIVYN